MRKCFMINHTGIAYDKIVLKSIGFGDSDKAITFISRHSYGNTPYYHLTDLTTSNTWVKGFELNKIGVL